MHGPVTQTPATKAPQRRPVVAFGPAMPGFGSWEWIGTEIAEALRDRFETVTFHDQVPDCDAAVFVKFRPKAAFAESVSRRAALLFCPVDGYGSGAEIDADEPFLSRCDRIVVHCHRLAPWFRPYARTEYVDHHLRFTAPMRHEYPTDGPIVWCGVHSNLGPLVEWVNAHPLPGELWILTNVGQDGRPLDPRSWGFNASNRVRMERWTPSLQREWTGLARAALDLKGDDFRQRHKPPVKALDFLVSGVPFATNAGSSPAEHLAELGFRVASPDDSDRWLSRDYFEETVRFGHILRETLSREQVADRWADLILEAIDARRERTSCRTKNRALTESPAVPTPAGALSSDSNPVPADRTKVALLSLLFNWPSTGGGTIHTYETAKFLQRAGYDVRHFYARYDGWRVGQVTGPLPYPATAIDFTDANWLARSIQRRFEKELDRFAPDWVIVTDSWNTKPLLAGVARGYRYLLRLAAQECLCPLNNVRLLIDADGKPHTCPKLQLAEPDACRTCVAHNGGLSGALHHAERALAGFGEPEYAIRLRGAFRDAAGVLAVNPQIAELVKPFAKAVHVVPSGFDPARFDLAKLDADLPPRADGKARLFFAGLTQEYMKGFAVLREACERLWRVRRDFELVATGDPPGRVNDFLEYVGWLSQDELPRQLRAADLLVFPTLAEEALGRSAVEAMACGRPVVASRIGGLPFTVRDGETGLMFEPGNVLDLMRQINRLLDDGALRERLGAAGRQRFESEYTWDVILAKQYVPLLGPAVRQEPKPEWAAAISKTQSAALGCVLAIQNRPADVLDRTLQTYAFQTVQPLDRVLVDFGSQPELSAAYEELCDRNGWRMVRVGPIGRPWSLSAAYNRAASELHSGVEVVFKGDVDVLLGRKVLETAARFGRRRLCLFACRTTCEGVQIPARLACHEDVAALLHTDPAPLPMDGEGIHAYPRKWFEEIGGFDLAFAGWGFEDSDLRLRATWSIGVERDSSALLVHQWHPRSSDSEQSARNRRYYDATKSARQVVRNGGRLLPPDDAPAVDLREAGRSPDWSAKPTTKVVVATRSFCEPLYRLSGEFLDFGRAEPTRLRPGERYRFTGTDAAGYLRELARIDADWVINLDEDAFVLDPQATVSLVAHMEQHGYAACGMPDGGVVPIRRHNPLALNTFFNVFDVRRIRAAWPDWEGVLRSEPPADAASDLPPFARRTASAFDRFEPYYGAFFALRNAGERILALDSETWDDGVSTVLKSLDGEPLLIHCWYARLWEQDPQTRDRYARAIEFAHSFRRGARRAALPPDSIPRPAAAANLIQGGL